MTSEKGSLVDAKIIYYMKMDLLKNVYPENHFDRTIEQCKSARIVRDSLKYLNGNGQNTDCIDKLSNENAQSLWT